MSALHPTRRRLLSGIAAGAGAALAGCAGVSTDETTVQDEPHDPRAGPPPGATTDFEVRTLRAPVEEPFVRFADEDAESQRRRNRQFVVDDGTAAAARFEAELEDEDVDELRSFLEETDYGNESIVVHQRSIDDCYERRVEYVIADPDRYRVQFCRELKDATTPCVAGKTGMEALFVRIPRAYDSSPSRRGSGERSRCHGDHWATAEVDRS